ncbi:MAG: pseudouridine synthase [Planctomycetota bacterium]|nr:pseudouridine synthase [Planctomycetota bacterium]
MNDPPEDIEILHLDDSVVVANKPPELLVHRSRESRDTVFLLQRLARQVDRFLYPVHRLDRAASGVIAMAFSSEAARDLQACLGADDAVKEYLVLVRGETPERGESRRPLTDRRTGVRKPACTVFERLAVFSRCSLLKVRIRTGRHHQIRRHLAHLRHQVIGDTSHGKGRINQFFRDEYGLPRLFLHAHLLDIRHPAGEGRLRVRAPLARDLREFLGRLPDPDPDLVARL